ncbi:MAG: hypothetical protein ACPGCU_05570, partial [Candidatus Poseidoniaceae archaeon]
PQEEFGDGLIPAGSSACWNGVVDFSQGITRCEFNVEFREASTPSCSKLSYGSSGINKPGFLFPVFLDEVGCGDPNACNFQSLCADNSVPCVYPVEYWTKDNSGNFLEFKGHVCEGEEINPDWHPKICSDDGDVQTTVPFFKVDLINEVSSSENHIVMQSEECEFQKAIEIVNTEFEPARLPSYVPTDSLLIFVDVGHRQNAVEDLWSGRSLVPFGETTDIVLNEDRHDNNGQAIELNDASGIGFVNENWGAWTGPQRLTDHPSLVNHENDGIDKVFTLAFWAEFDHQTLLDMPVDSRVSIFQDSEYAIFLAKGTPTSVELPNPINPLEVDVVDVPQWHFEIEGCQGCVGQEEGLSGVSWSEWHHYV